jgi:hypothetical protein
MRHTPPSFDARVRTFMFALCCCLFFTACAPLAALRGTGQAQAVEVGRDLMTAEVRDAPTRSPITHDQAIQAAKQYAPTWNTASTIDARFVTLTLQAGGKVAWGVEARPVWLVRFEGARYAINDVPMGSCACTDFDPRPSMAVALDGTDGSLVVAYGFGK